MIGITTIIKMWSSWFLLFLLVLGTYQCMLRHDVYVHIIYINIISFRYVYDIESQTYRIAFSFGTYTTTTKNDKKRRSHQTADSESLHKKPDWCFGLVIWDTPNKQHVIFGEPRNPNRPWKMHLSKFPENFQLKTPRHFFFPSTSLDASCV